MKKNTISKIFDGFSGKIISCHLMKNTISKLDNLTSNERNSIDYLTRLWANCWRQSLAMPLMVVAILMIGYTVEAQNILGRAPVAFPKGGFAIDGNAFVNYPGPPATDNTAWGDFLFEPGYVETVPNIYKAKSPGGIFVPVPPTYLYPDGVLPPEFYVYPGFTTFLRDNITSQDPTSFLMSNKIDHNVSDFKWGVGSSPDKNEIQNAIAHFSFGDPSIQLVVNGVPQVKSNGDPIVGNVNDLWMIFAADRQVTNGSSYIDFEILQKRLNMRTDGIDNKGFAYGGFDSEAGTTSGRTNGDLLVTVEFTQGGGAANVVVRKWNGIEYIVFTPTPGTIFATNNDVQTIVPYPIYNQAPISTTPVPVWAYAPNQWAEGAVNVSKFFPENPCFTISTLFVRTRTSGSSGQSELKDFPGAPFQLFLDLTPTATAVATNVSCFGGATGAIDLTIKGGTAPFTYAWTKVGDPTFSAATEDLTGLAIGTYNVTVTSNSGCTTTATATITQPAAAVTTSGTHTNVLCFGASTGSVTVNFSGGTSPYTVSFNGGAYTTQVSGVVYSGLAAGTYAWIVRDANGTTGGCTASGSETITQPAAAVTTSGTHTNVLCFGASTGSVTVNFSGGTSPYTVSFNGGAYTTQVSGVVYSGLAAGTYAWIVRDANGTTGGCTASGSETITQPDALSASATPSAESCIGADGSISLTVSGGAAPYKYLWSNGATSKDVSGLSPGAYTVVITDANGCVKNSGATVNAPDNCAHIFPTQTTCCNYLKGDTQVFVLKNVCVTLGTKGNNPNVISNAIPGVFFYYGDFTATSGDQTTIIVDQTSFNVNGKFDPQNISNVRLFVDDCQTVAPSLITIIAKGPNKGNVTIVFTPIVGKKYVVSVKYDTKSIIGSTFQTGAYATFGMNIKVGVNPYGPRVSVGKINLVKDCSDNTPSPGSCSFSATVAPVDTTTAKTTEVAGFTASPVPFEDQLTIKYDFDYVSKVNIEVFDAQGGKIHSQLDTNSYLGKEVVLKLNVKRGQEQVYIVKLTTDRGSSTKKVMSSK
ncbi:Por secretion system C-terminal sorting domain-containing protein [Flavobacterium gillisiae]|uniref:Por secretion system C-terminal sorting domain-containing protein n=1 Tax=Flavobacterium gillisiae TaxID=150146 RepID=A0A1H3XWW0_9FLAO|nr:T9SS type A sorting domain-containing protein [Flavobacterium gillisiae]SEA03730.1 Por secretion system C-terminal sorting domain-containing protein [Flavobacterium gillisiae]